MADRLENLLRSCTVRVIGGPAPGAGFLVAPRMVLTCAHVIGDNTALVVRWERDGQPVLEARVSGRIVVLADRGRPIRALDADYPDIAVLEIDGLGHHPCVGIDNEWPLQEDSFQVYGYPEEGGAVQLTPARLTYRGMHGTSPTIYLDLASDKIKPGMSGAALLNLRSGAVCGVVVATKHSAYPDGALAIPWSAIAPDLTEVVAANRAFHLQDRTWKEAITGLTVETVRGCDPLDLGVHRVLPPSNLRAAGGPESLTPYLRREHDKDLRAALHQAAKGGRSVLAVLAGGSCTGKTRALYEALMEVVPDWPLQRPADADELIELLEEGRFQTGTVLWLNETQRHLSGSSGERAATLLRSKLEATNGAVAVGALWDYPYLEELILTGNSPDTHAAARLLLDGPRTRKITVPKCLTSQQRQELAAFGGGDERLSAALAASGSDGDVIQHLTGGPELLDAYINDGLFTPVERAFITATLDARRLGHRAPIPATLLTAAADGYLSPRQRPGQDDWASTALNSLAKGRRPDGTRTSIRNALTALKTERARSGDIETGYEPDDYLDQHSRRSRETCLGTRELWDALAERTHSPDDLARLGDAAFGRGLYRHAALLWRHTIAVTGNTAVAVRLISLLHGLDCDGARDACHWVAERISLDAPFSIAALLEALADGGDEAAVLSLAARAANEIALDDPFGLGELLGALDDAGAEEALSTLAARAAGNVAINDHVGVATLLTALRHAEAEEAFSTLAVRAVNDVTLDDPEGVSVLLRELREAEAEEAFSTLTARAASNVALDDCERVADLLRTLRFARAYEAVLTLASRAANDVVLDDPRGIAALLGALRYAGAVEAVSVLLARYPAEHAALDDPGGVAALLRALRDAGSEDAVLTLAARAASNVALDYSESVAGMLGEAPLYRPRRSCVHDCSGGCRRAGQGVA